MFQDEARFGRINDVRRCWAPKPVRPLCQAMLTHETTYAYAAVDVLTGELDSLILPHVNTQCMQLFVDEVGQRHPDKHIIMVLDGAGWHAGSDLHPPANMRLLSLPPYAPELNPVEHVWDELREEALPQPRLRQPGCAGGPPRARPQRFRARAPAHPIHRRLALDY